MENIKQKLSDVAHSWTVIGMITLFLFGVQPETMTPAKALVVKPETKTEAQLKKETLEKFSNTVYKPSEMLTDKELLQLLKSVGFEGRALKLAWAVAKSESNGRPMAYNGNRKKIIFQFRSKPLYKRRIRFQITRIERFCQKNCKKHLH